MILVYFIDFKARHEPGGRAAAKLAAQRHDKKSGKASASAKASSDAGANPLLVDLGQGTPSSARAAIWFGQDDFKVSGGFFVQSAAFFDNLTGYSTFVCSYFCLV